MKHQNMELIPISQVYRSSAYSFRLSSNSNTKLYIEIRITTSHPMLTLRNNRNKNHYKVRIEDLIIYEVLFFADESKT